MDITNFDYVLLFVFISWLLGFYALLTGWAMVRSPEKNKPMYFKIAIGISWILHDRNSADKKESELMNPTRIRRHGFLRVGVGTLVILGGSLQVVGLILK